MEFNESNWIWPLKFILEFDKLLSHNIYISDDYEH